MPNANGRFLAISIIATFCGCSPATPATSDTAGLILQYERLHCAWNLYSYPYDALQPVLGFFQRGANEHVFAPSGVGQGFGAQMQNFGYVDHDGTQRVAQFWWEPTYEIRVFDCMYLPTGVQILDTTPDQTGKLAHVIFRNTGNELTAFGERFLRDSSQRLPPEKKMWLGNKQESRDVEIDNVELVAQLQKLDATGWRVVGIAQGNR
jgi:hypothetical protein